MTERPEVTAVRVVDLDVPFWRLVNLLVKLALASVPALLVLVVYGVAIATLLDALLGR